MSLLTAPIVKNSNIEARVYFIFPKSCPQTNIPFGNYMFKVYNRNTRTRCEICSKLTIKTPERRYWRRY